MSKKYRDSFFRNYFNDKTRLLELCNALIGEDGKNPEEIEINTLDGVFFGKLKNDLSCIYRGKFLVIIEHQSTVNENMPLRIFLYAAEIFKRFAEKNKNNLYSGKLLTLPAPEFFVFYNGREKEVERREMKLSDAFGEENKFLEVIVKVYNINFGFNENFIEKISPLKNYCTFVNRVEKNFSAGMTREQAIAETFYYCLEKNIMTEYLLSKKEELINMLGFEYNEEDAKRAFIEYGEEKGIERGIETGIERGKIELVRKLLNIDTPLKYIVEATGWNEEKILQIGK